MCYFQKEIICKPAEHNRQNYFMVVYLKSLGRLVDD